jgi:hypothetical protein
MRSRMHTSSCVCTYATDVVCVHVSMLGGEHTSLHTSSWIFIDKNKHLHRHIFALDTRNLYQIYVCVLVLVESHEF